MSIDRKTVLHTAALARLDLLGQGDEAIDGLTDELNKILGYVELLAEVDTDGVPASVHPVTMPMALRPDRANKTPGTAAIVGRSAAHDRGAFLVPRVVEGGQEHE